jgi:hypothetical protein
MEILLSIVGGGIITIATAIFVEYLRAPKLTMVIEDPPLNVPTAPPKKHLRLKLQNEALPRGFRWMQRSAALQCRGEITFHSLEGQNIFGGKAMAIRWASNPPPVRITGQIVDLQDPAQVQSRIVDFTGIESTMDVYPGEDEIFDVAVRFLGEQEGYGWNNESYYNNWRTPDWRLPRGTYLVRAAVTSSGNKCVRLLRLQNEVDPLSGFCLTLPLPVDEGKVP